MSVGGEIEEAITAKCGEDLVAHRIDGTAKVFNLVKRFRLLGASGLVKVVSAEAAGLVGCEEQGQLITGNERMYLNFISNQKLTT